MNSVYILLAAVLLIMETVPVQSQPAVNGTYDSRRVINNKKFHVLYEEVAIDKSVDEVWQEVAGNFMNIDEIIKNVNYTRCLSGDTIQGLGASRYCNLDVQGKTVEITERIIDYQENGDNREFTYHVYESKGIPLKSYNTWVVRKGEDGKTYLGTVFIFRANFAPITGFIEKKLKKSGLKDGILAYKHYLETGEKKVAPNKLHELYLLE